jgi:hypothetical protein
MRRREFLVSMGASALLVRGANAAIPEQSSSGWRRFEVRARIDVTGVIQGKGPTRLWVPLPLARNTTWQRLVGQQWRGNAMVASMVRDAASGASILSAVFDGDQRQPSLDVTMTVDTRDVAAPVDRIIDRGRVDISRDDLNRYLSPTALIPTDGIVREQALVITRGLRNDHERRPAPSTTGSSSIPSAIPR